MRCQWRAQAIAAKPGTSRASKKAPLAPDQQAHAPRPTPDNKWTREDPDVKLMLAFQAGDESAFEKLVQRNQSNVHAVIYRFLGDQSDVEDLSQEVFLRVYRTAHRYVPTAKFTTWLYRIAANLSLNAIRSRSKVKIAQLEIPDDSSAAGGFYREVEDTAGDRPSDDMDAAELHEQILMAVHRLPENQRIAIILNKFEQMSYDDIAEVLGVSMMAVKSLLSRARSNLRQSLQRFMKP